jgi:MG2 domain
MRLDNAMKSATAAPLVTSSLAALLVFSVFAVSMLTIMSLDSNSNYAYGQTIRALELKVNFKKLVEAGSTQNVRLSLRDMESGLAVSTATVRMTVYFPGGVPIRQFNLLTDKDGFASLSLPISNNAPLGSYGLDVLAGAPGFFDTSLTSTQTFAVMSDVKQNVDADDYSHARSHIRAVHDNNNHHHD